MSAHDKEGFMPGKLVPMFGVVVKFNDATHVLSRHTSLDAAREAARRSMWADATVERVFVPAR